VMLYSAYGISRGSIEEDESACAPGPTSHSHPPKKEFPSFCSFSNPQSGGGRKVPPLQTVSVDASQPTFSVCFSQVFVSAKMSIARQGIRIGTGPACRFSTYVTNLTTLATHPSRRDPYHHHHHQRPLLPALRTPSPSIINQFLPTVPLVTLFRPQETNKKNLLSEPPLLDRLNIRIVCISFSPYLSIYCCDRQACTCVQSESSSVLRRSLSPYLSPVAPF
jgi:hypothetical protein